MEVLRAQPPRRMSSTKSLPPDKSREYSSAKPATSRAPHVIAFVFHDGWLIGLARAFEPNQRLSHCAPEVADLAVRYVIVFLRTLEAEGGQHELSFLGRAASLYARLVLADADVVLRTAVDPILVFSDLY